MTRRIGTIPLVATLVVVVLAAIAVGQAAGAFDLRGGRDYPDSDIVRPGEQPTIAAVSLERPICEDAPDRCDFARSVADQVRSGDVDGLLATSEPMDVECAESPERQPACAGVSPGGTVQGYNRSIFASASSLELPADFRELLLGSVGDPSTRLMSVACEQRDREARAPDCSGEFAVALEVSDSVLILLFRPFEDTLGLYGLYQGGPLTQENAASEGGYVGLAGVFPNGNVGQGFHFQVVE